MGPEVKLPMIAFVGEHIVEAMIAMALLVMVAFREFDRWTGGRE